MSSIGFDILDRLVIDGKGAEIALKSDAVALTYADLLEKVAAMSGALLQLGATDGDSVAIDLEIRHHHVIAVLACIRVGVIPGAVGEIRFEGISADSIARVGDQSYQWRELMRAGSMNPAAALESDRPGYREQVVVGQSDLLRSLKC